MAISPELARSLERLINGPGQLIPPNNATRALQRTQSGISFAKDLGVLPSTFSLTGAQSAPLYASPLEGVFNLIQQKQLTEQSSPLLNAVLGGKQGLLGYGQSALRSQGLGLPDAWKGISADFNIPLAQLTPLAQANFDPAAFKSFLTESPSFAQQLLGQANAAGGAFDPASLLQALSGVINTPAASALTTLGGAIAPSLTGAIAPYLPGAIVPSLVGAIAPSLAGAAGAVTGAAGAAGNALLSGLSAL